MGSLKYFHFKLSHINMETGSAVLRGNSYTRRVQNPQMRRIKAGITTRMNTSIDFNIELRNKRSASASIRIPKTLKGNLMSDYGTDIHKHLKSLESNVD